MLTITIFIDKAIFKWWINERNVHDPCGSMVIHSIHHDSGPSRRKPILLQSVDMRPHLLKIMVFFLTILLEATPPIGIQCFFTCFYINFLNNETCSYG